MAVGYLRNALQQDPEALRLELLKALLDANGSQIKVALRYGVSRWSLYAVLGELGLRGAPDRIQTYRASRFRIPAA